MEYKVTVLVTVELELTVEASSMEEAVEKVNKQEYEPLLVGYAGFEGGEDGKFPMLSAPREGLFKNMKINTGLEALLYKLKKHR